MYVHMCRVSVRVHFRTPTLLAHHLPLFAVIVAYQHWPPTSNIHSRYLQYIKYHKNTRLLFVSIDEVIMLFVLLFIYFYYEKKNFVIFKIFLNLISHTVAHFCILRMIFTGMAGYWRHIALQLS